VKHVFIETNFLIDVLRPLPNAQAEGLLSRQAAGELRLYVPWSSIGEARRTLDRIIREDLGFVDRMMEFSVREFLANRDAGRPPSFEKKEIDKLKALAERAKGDANQTKNARVDALVAKLAVIEPSRAVVERTLQLFGAKSLKPFDEMALGAVLARAQELYDKGERELHFCTLDKGDLGPSPDRPNLTAAYAACGLAFHRDFKL
jgi:predicted nucleic acid-binding protein